MSDDTLIDTPKEFWIVNISDRNVSLSDLALTVRAKSNANLLDSKHYNYTWEQINNSVNGGSLAKKSKLIKIRKVAPKIEVKPGLYTANESRAVKARSQIVIEERVYEELDLSDEKFAALSLEEDEK